MLFLCLKENKYCRRKGVHRMFDNKRYMTKGIDEEIPLEIQLYLWNCIDTLKEKGRELDYLQVFKLEKIKITFANMEYQMIEHRQEVPQFMMSYNIFPTEMVDANIFVIDDGRYSTMMLSAEY